MVKGAFLTIDFKAENFGFVEVNLRRQNNCLFKGSHKDMRHRSSKISSVKIDRFELWDVHLFALWTEHLYPTRPKLISKSNRQNFLLLAKSSRAKSVNLVHKLMVNFSKSRLSQDESCMNQAIEVTSFLVQLQELLISKIFRGRSIGTSYHLQSRSKIQIRLLISIRFELFLEPVEVEVIVEVISLDLHKEILSFEGAEPLDPSLRPRVIVRNVIEIYI